MELTSGQRIFAQRLAARTGLNSRVISAWILTEMNGGAAAGREREGNHNWLNIGYFDSGPGGITKDKAFSDPRRSADQTAKFLQGKWGGASSGIRQILRTAGADPQRQIRAIGTSGWATNPRYQEIISAVHSRAPAPGAGTRLVSTPTSRTRASTASVATDDPKARQQALLGYLASSEDADPHTRLLSLAEGLKNAKTQPTQAPNSSPSSEPRSSSGASIGDKSPLKELFYDPQGGWKNGQNIGPIGGHGSHVHLAAGPKTLIAIGQRAQKMGLRVGENNNFGDSPDPGVHTPTSNHYQKGGTGAIDVSGEKPSLDAFARWVRRLYKLR